MSRLFSRRKTSFFSAVLIAPLLGMLIFVGCGEDTGVSEPPSSQNTAGGGVSAPSTSQAGTTSEVQKAAKPSAAAQTPASQAGPDSAEQEVHAAIDDAIRRLQTGDFRGFIEYDMPIEQLRTMRQQKAVDQVVASMKSDPKTVEDVIKPLGDAPQTRPVFN